MCDFLKKLTLLVHVHKKTMCTRYVIFSVRYFSFFKMGFADTLQNLTIYARSLCLKSGYVRVIFLEYT
jgi:hypothetical protein